MRRLVDIYQDWKKLPGQYCATYIRMRLVWHRNELTIKGEDHISPERGVRYEISDYDRWKTTSQQGL